MTAPQNWKCFELRISKEVYDKEAAIAASYAVSKWAVIKIEPESSDFLKVIFDPSTPSSDAEWEEIKRKFLLELNDQQLRIHLETRYGPLRQLILKQAFSPIEDLKAEVKKIVGRE